MIHLLETILLIVWHIKYKIDLQSLSFPEEADTQRWGENFTPTSEEECSQGMRTEILYHHLELTMSLLTVEGAERDEIFKLYISLGKPK